MNHLFDCALEPLAAADFLQIETKFPDPADRLAVYASFVRECLGSLLDAATAGLSESSAIGADGYATTYQSAAGSLTICRNGARLTVEREGTFELDGAVVTRLGILQEALAGLADGGFRAETPPPASAGLALKTGRGIFLVDIVGNRAGLSKPRA